MPFTPHGRPLATVALAFLLARSTLAADPAPWSVRVWKTDDGLPNNYVTGIAQTADGFVWVGTYSCLARFDGARFQEYFPGSIAGADTSRITAVQLSAGGGLWLGLLHGSVVRIAPDGAQVFTEGLPAKQVQSMVEDGEGALWIAYSYYTGTLYRILHGQVQAFGRAEGLPPAQLPACGLAADEQGRLWVGKNGIIERFQDGRFHPIFRLDAQHQRRPALDPLPAGHAGRRDVDRLCRRRPGLAQG